MGAHVCKYANMQEQFLGKKRGWRGKGKRKEIKKGRKGKRKREERKIWKQDGRPNDSDCEERRIWDNRGGSESVGTASMERSSAKQVTNKKVMKVGRSREKNTSP